MKLKLAAIALFCSAAMMCSESNADLLGRMLGRGGCGGCQAASSCCDTPAPACGGRNLGISININIGMPGRLFGGRCGGGLLSGGGCGGGLMSGGCGSVAPAMAPVDSGCGCGGAVVQDSGCGCGSKLFNGSLLARLKGRLGSIGNGNCGCGSAAPAADCGCNAAPAPSCGPTCGGGCGSSGLFQGGLLGKLRGIGSGSCGCGSAAPAADCGCNAAPMPAPVMMPASNCGCDSAPACGCGGAGGKLRGRVSGLLSRLKGSLCGSCGASAGDCGCGAAPIAMPAVSSCGCDSAPACGCGSAFGGKLRNLGSRLKARCNSCGSSACDGGCGGGRLGLLDRLRGNRTVRSGCNDGCKPACPNSGCNGGCSSCGGGAVQYDGGAMYQSAPAPTMAPVQGTPIQAAPIQAAPVPAAAVPGSVTVPSTDGASVQPVVDPGAFVIRK